MSLVLSAGTDYHQTKGDAATTHSKGADPGPYVEAATSSAAAKPERDIRHIKDYQDLANVFSLDLPDPADPLVFRLLSYLADIIIQQLETHT
jgi:hypothetical protein